MRSRHLLFAASAAVGLAGCKSLPMGSFQLLNTPAMQIAKTAPAIVVEPGEAITFASDGQIAGMAISGGGIRASAFTLGVFAGLQEIAGSGGNETALDRIDFASSNSGGSWALAAAMTNKRLDRTLVKANDLDQYLRRFEALNKSSTKHWAAAMQKMLTPNGTTVTMGDIRHTRPRAYFNSSMLPSQDPFVFTEQFVHDYRVTGFYARASKQVKDVAFSLDSVPLGFVAATSGSVPGFTHSYASTTLCPGAAGTPSFCAGTDGGWLRLVDGGLYDNTAYKTAWEVARSAVRGGGPARRTVLLIDSKNGWPMPTALWKDASKHKGLFKSGSELLFQGSFPMQEATYRRLAPQMFDAIGFTSVLLDFDAASGFTPAMETLVADLPHLQAMAADEIDCITETGEVIKARKRPKNKDIDAIDWLKRRGGDCFENNFARVGYHHKTTYEFDRAMFAATYQLGVFVARRRAAEIRAALDIK